MSHKTIIRAAGILVLILFMDGPSVLAEKTVTDLLGRTIRLKEHPGRIISLAPNITEIIFALHQQDRLIGATLFSDYPAGAKDLPKVGSYVNLDIEKIVALQPDLCIATKDGNPKEVVDILDHLNIPVYVVDPRNLETVMSTLLEVGTLLDASEAAAEVVSQMSRRLELVKSRVAKTDNRPKVFYQIGISPIVSAGTDTCIHELIELAGGRNIAAGPVPYPRYSREQILGLAPDVFIITSMARGAVFESVKAQWQKYPGLSAVRNNKLMLVDSNLLDRPTPRLIDGLEMLARIIHPEVFAKSPWNTPIP